MTARIGAPPKPVPQDLADIIVEQVGRGVPLAEIVRSDPRFPKALTTVYDWIIKDPIFAQRYAQARVAGYDAIAADMLRIADTPLEGVKRKVTADGVEITEEDMLGHRKLQVDTRRWLLSKWDPKRYGERVEVAGDPDAPLIAADASPNALARTIAFALHQGLREKQLNSIPGEAEQVDDGADMV